MESKSFDFNAFVADSKKALLSPEEYFSSMPAEGGLAAPVIKALIYGAAAGVLNLIWSSFNIGVGGIFGAGVGVMVFIGSIIGALLGLFIGAVIILILSAIANGKTDFEPMVHVQGALLVIMPVSAFVNVFSAIHPTLGSFLNLAVNLYLLYMLFFAMTKTLNAKVDVSKIIVIVLGVLLILMFFVGLATRGISRAYRGWQQAELKEVIYKREKPDEGSFCTFHSFCS